MKDDRHYLRFMLSGIAAIDSYLADNRRALFEDRRTQKAVLRELHEIAETAQRISAQLRNKFPDVPWGSISAFRNVVVHDYLGIDLQRIEEVVNRDLPQLNVALRQMLDELK